MNIGEWLRDRRLAIDPNAENIGKCRRIATRVGRRVSQEEAAEAVGVSREWYSRLENGAYERLSDALEKRIEDLYGVAPHDGRLTTNALGDIRDLARQLRWKCQASDAAGACADALQAVVKPTVGSALVLAENPRIIYAAGIGRASWTPWHGRFILNVHAERVADGSSVIARLPLVSPNTNDVTLQYTRTRDGLTYSHGVSAEQWRYYNADLAVQSGLAVPLFGVNRFAGLMIMGWNERDAVTMEHVAAAEAISEILRLAWSKETPIAGVA